jgi:predicted transposase YbfD/YdcC
MSKKNTKDAYSEIDQIVDSEAFVACVKSGFKEVKDPRTEDNNSYPLVSLLVMVLCAIIAGANAITQIHEYAEIKIGLFQRLLGVDRAPSYSVFWWLLTRLNPKQLQDAFINWINSLPNEIKERIIAIDGKRLRGASHKQSVHLVAAWETSRGLLLGQVKTEEKSNEITAIPELLKTIDIKGAMVTIDAAGCQTGITDQIRDQNGDYMIALKGNQGTLHDEAQNFFAQAEEVGYAEAECVVSTSCEKGHGRIEERKVVVTNQLEWLDAKVKDRWRDLNSLIEVTCRREIKGKISEEKRYYISNLILGSEKAGNAARSHWGIENHLHWTMDVVFLEDASQASTGHAAENLAVFRRMAHNLITADLGGTRGVAKSRRQAAWNDDYAVRLLSRIFEGKV